MARWMLIGFVHGVMNTDNMTISGETIDYGPCAFMEAYNPNTVFSSIDQWGRYAYGNQPAIAGWNLARFAEEGPSPEEMERAQAQLEREWLDRLATVGGRADELCRYAVLFGDPQLALTAVQRILEITPEEVRAVAAARLRPDNRAVLVYEPTGAPDGGDDRDNEDGEGEDA